eukprot:675896_1
MHRRHPNAPHNLPPIPCPKAQLTHRPQERDNLDRNGDTNVSGDGHTVNLVQRTHGSDASSFGFNMYGSVQFDHDFMEEFAENNGAPHTTLKRTSFIPIIAQASSPPERTSQPSTCTTFHLDNLDPNDDTNASEFTYHTHPIPLSSGATSTLIEPYPCGGFAHSKQSMSSASDAILFGLKRDDLIAPFSNLSDDTHTKHKKCAAKYVESQVNEDIHTLDMIQSQHPSAFDSEEAPPIFGTDYILRYAVMALAVWVSLFSFYRLIRLSSMQLLLSAWLFVAMGRVNALSVCDPVHSMFIINSELIVNDAETQKINDFFEDVVYEASSELTGVGLVVFGQIPHELADDPVLFGLEETVLRHRGHTAMIVDYVLDFDGLGFYDNSSKRQSMYLKRSQLRITCLSMRLDLLALAKRHCLFWILRRTCRMEGNWQYARRRPAQRQQSGRI